MHKLPDILVENVLMDVDETMTATDGTPDGMDVSPTAHLENLLIATYGISREEANRRIHASGDVETTCLSEFLPALGIESHLYWDAMRGDLAKHTTIPDDAGAFIRALKAKAILLYSATTNSRFMTLLKLSLGGLADIDGSPYMAGYHGGDSFGEGEGKYSPNFFPLILKHGNFNPETTMMVGDDLIRDFQPAQRAGIRYCVLIDRSQKEKLILKDGGIFVNSLLTIIDSIHKR